MKKLAIFLLCLALTACLDTESGRPLLTESNKLLVPDFNSPAYMTTEELVRLDTEDGVGIIFEFYRASLTTEDGQAIITESNDATLEI